MEFILDIQKKMKKIRWFIVGIYPNPITNGELIIESGELSAGDKIEIFNMTGTRLGVYEAKGSVTAIINSFTVFLLAHR